MKNFFKVVFSRAVFTGAFIALQFAAVYLAITRFNEHFAIFYGVCLVLSAVVVVYLVSRDGNPAYKIAWIIPILALPVFGVLLYLVFGKNQLSLKEKARMSSVAEQYEKAMRSVPAAEPALPEHTDAKRVSDYLHRAAGAPVFTHTETTYLPVGEVYFDTLLAELEKAEKFIFMEYYIIAPGTMWNAIHEVLRRKAESGVDVRVMYDDFGCITRLPMRYCKKLREMGIQAHVFNPFIPVLSGRLNNRDHRKLMIIDGKVGFTGGVNLADEYINEIERFGHWKDCGILVRGEAVWSMVMMFLSIWDYVAGLEEDVAAFRPDYPEAPAGEGYLQPFADSPLDHEDVGATIFQSLIQSASSRVWIMTPYLILDDKMVSALCVAAKTGVDVRIITPGIPDKWYVHAVTRANYEVLTEAGVRIFEYKPGFIHSKVCLSDNRYAVVGTVNMDFRSLYLHFEDAVYLYGSPAVRQVAADFEETFPVCREMTYARCRHVHFYQRVIRTLLQVFSPLL